MDFPLIDGRFRPLFPRGGKRHAVVSRRASKIDRNCPNALETRAIRVVRHAIGLRHRAERCVSSRPAFGSARGDDRSRRAVLSSAVHP